MDRFPEKYEVFCQHCGVDRLITDFTISKSKYTNRDGVIKEYVSRRSKCKFCESETRAESDATYREKNREGLKEKSTLWRRKYKQEWVEFLSKYFKLECSKCGYNKSFVALDFHHTDPTEKENAISQMIIKAPTKSRKIEVLAEAYKCVILCSNCHREHHTPYDPILEGDING